MLVLSRKHGEGIWIGGTLVKVEIRGGNVKLAIDAPKNVRIWRQELIEAPDQEPEGELVEA